MSNFLKALKKGVQAGIETFGPGKYSAGGIEVFCPHCKNEIFEKGEVQLNTAFASFLNLDWLNKSATILVCTKCGLIQWFGKNIEKID